MTPEPELEREAGEDEFVPRYEPPPLIAAAEAGDAASLASLLDQGAALDTRGSGGVTALMRAAARGGEALPSCCSRAVRRPTRRTNSAIPR